MTTTLTPPFEIGLLPITEQDLEFLYRVYESTRWDELAPTGWTDEEIRAFLRMQFRMQHTQYLQNYDNASFDIILIDGAKAGRLYVHRKKDDIRVIDIALLPEFRRKCVGRKLLGGLAEEADRKGLPLSLHVEHNNPVLGFYERLGFRKIDINGIYFFMKREPAVHSGKNQEEKEAVMIEKLKISSFHPHVGDKFEIATKAGGKVVLELVEIKDTSTDIMDSFHLIFKGPKDNVFSHDTHKVSHPKIGEFDLFLGPVIYGSTDAVYYQAVFNRLRASAKTRLKAVGKAGKTAKKKAGGKSHKPSAKKSAKATRSKKR